MNNTNQIVAVGLYGSSGTGVASITAARRGPIAGTNRCTTEYGQTSIVGDVCDNRPTGDTDGDGVDNGTDNCPTDDNEGQTDTDSDGSGNACDATPNGDTGGDGVDNGTDNCGFAANPTQGDSDGDGIGDACDPTANLNVPPSQKARQRDGWRGYTDASGRAFRTKANARGVRRTRP